MKQYNKKLFYSHYPLKGGSQGTKPGPILFLVYKVQNIASIYPFRFLMSLVMTVPQKDIK